MKKVGIEKNVHSFEQSTSSFENCTTTKNKSSIKPTKSTQGSQSKLNNDNEVVAINSTKSRYECNISSHSQLKLSGIQKYPKKPSIYKGPNENDEKTEAAKLLVKGISLSEGKVFGNPEFVVSDCWGTTSGEVPVKFVQLLKESNLEEDDSDIPVKKRKLDPVEDKLISPPYTKEFHLLTEVQKERILTAVEDAIKKLANEDFCHHASHNQIDRPTFGVPPQTSVERFICKKFLLPWVIMKVVEMVLCHIIQLTFLSEDSYFQKKNEFLPIVVTFYLTLFIVVISLLVHISCFSYVGIQNPCYFMGIISSSILTLTTSFGILIMLSSMEFYKSFHEILVLIFVGVLLCSLFAELCLCYVQVKTIWHRVGQTDQYYIS